MNSISSTENVLSDTLAALQSDNVSFLDRSLLGNLAYSEMEARAESLRIQNEINDATKEQIQAQTRLIAEKTRRIASGDGMSINVNAEGLEYDLGLVLKKLIERAQIEASGDTLLV